jgi:hypothetical protein
VYIFEGQKCCRLLIETLVQKHHPQFFGKWMQNFAVKINCIGYWQQGLCHRFALINEATISRVFKGFILTQILQLKFYYEAKTLHS